MANGDALLNEREQQKKIKELKRENDPVMVFSYSFVDSRAHTYRKSINNIPAKIEDIRKEFVVY